MAGQVAPIPPGYHSLTPYLVVKDPAAAIEFYKKAFGAEQTVRLDGPDGRVMHAEVRIGDSMLMLSGEWPQFGNLAPLPNHHSASLLIYTPDVDRAFEQAVKAGCTVVQPVADQFWGDRFGKLLDPFGHAWAIATHKEDLTDAQINERARKLFGG